MMKRTTSDSELIRWKKIGGGSLHLPNRIIKPNQEFSARLEDIPEQFRDVIVPLNPKMQAVVDKAEKAAGSPAVKLKYFVKARSAGYYDVVDKDGKVMNEKALRKEAAETLIESLQE